MSYLSRHSKDIRRKKQLVSSVYCASILFQGTRYQQCQQRCTLLALWEDKKLPVGLGINVWMYQVCSFTSVPWPTHFKSYQRLIVSPLLLFLGRFTSSGIEVKTVKLIEQLACFILMSFDVITSCFSLMRLVCNHFKPLSRPCQHMLCSETWAKNQCSIQEHHMESMDPELELGCVNSLDN